MNTKIKTNDGYYHENDAGELNGESKAWYGTGQLWVHEFWANGELHGERKTWHEDGQLGTHCFYKDGKWHGEYKSWYDDGTLYCWTYDVNDEVVINFLENPELYPTTPEERTYFALKYGYSRLLPMEERPWR